MITRRMFLQRPARIPLRKAIVGVRLQHNQNGLHKEYFQDPSQFPSSFQSSQNNVASQISRRPTAQSQLQPEPQSPQGPSLIRRAIRGTLLVNIFLLLGWIAGTGVLTWEYLQPPYDRDSEEHQELQEEIEDLLENCAVSEDFREAGWREEPIIKSRTPVHGSTTPAGDRHLVEETLSGNQGVMMKVFRHPTEHATALVFFAGFGIEGWPDKLHGGAIMSVMNEAAAKHTQPISQTEGLSNILGASGMDQQTFSFVKPLRPGEVFTIMLLPKSWGLAAAADDDDAKSYVLMSTLAFLFSSESAPQFLRDPLDPQALHINAKDGVLHAHGLISTWAATDIDLKKRNDESDSDHSQRVKAAVDRFSAHLGEGSITGSGSITPDMVNMLAGINKSSIAKSTEASDRNR